MNLSQIKLCSDNITWTLADVADLDPTAVQVKNGLVLHPKIRMSPAHITPTPIEGRYCITHPGSGMLIIEGNREQITWAFDLLTLLDWPPDSRTIQASPECRQHRLLGKAIQLVVELGQIPDLATFERRCAAAALAG